MINIEEKNTCPQFVKPKFLPQHPILERLSVNVTDQVSHPDKKQAKLQFCIPKPAGPSGRVV
jgi:hypothetical protein